MRSRLSPGWQVDVEAPFQCRDYEAAWPFDRSITRFLIAGVAGGGAGQFANLLELLRAPFGNLLLEAAEMWGDIAYLQRTLDLKHYSESHLNEANWRSESQRMLADGIISLNGSTCSFVAKESGLTELLDKANVLEWYGSYWQDKAPYSIAIANIFEYKLGRTEPAMLKSMGICAPVFFLSPNHEHLELMVTQQDTEKVLEILALN